MNDTLNNAIEILENLVSFDSLSRKPTHGIIGYIQRYLNDCGIESILSFDEDGERANLFATIGPAIDGGVVLNGHTDVVPVDGQSWATDPFVLTRKDNRLYGRGSVDMKGFLACVLASAPLFKSANLASPVHIAFSYDEEVGGFGMPVLLNSMAKLDFRPGVVVVGEPTEMKLITGHKGGFEMRTEITGLAVHSCDPAKGVSAISVAAKLITKIYEIGERLASDPDKDSAFEPPFGTFNVGTIEGGTASNATAGWCNFDWEFRPMPTDNGNKIIAEVEAYAKNELLPTMKTVSSTADIKIVTEASIPALDETNATDAAEFVSLLTGINEREVVSFGTDAGYFSNAGISTVVFGPGSISRAHKPDEYIEIEELSEGLAFLKKISQRLSV